MISKALAEPIRVKATGPDIEIVSPDGRAEVLISFTEAGPVVRVRADRIQLEGRELSMQLDRLSVETRDEIRLHAQGDVHVDGAVVRLNCAEPRE